MVAEAEKLSRRAHAKERRRQQLIDATIKCISKKGLGSTTLSDVAREAGLSQGIVNLHFDSKDNLLAETLRFLAEEYDQQFMQTLDESPPAPAAKLLALKEMSLKPTVCDRPKLAVWFAFMGEAKAVPTYQKICAAREKKYADVTRELVEKIVQDGDYPDIDAREIADALSALSDGLWLSCLINPKSFDRTRALASVRSYLRATFPDHYRKKTT